MASQVMLVVKNLPVSAGRNKGHGFNPWGWEDPLEKEMATHSSIFAENIPWTVELVGCSPRGCK